MDKRKCPHCKSEIVLYPGDVSDRCPDCMKEIPTLESVRRRRNEDITG